MIGSLLLLVAAFALPTVLVLGALFLLGSALAAMADAARPG